MTTIATPRMTSASLPRLYAGALYALFFLSGATGLIYEIMWNRKLTLIFGATVYSVTTILTVFFTGLALGAWLIGRYVDRSKNVIGLYVGLELAIGAFGILSPLLFMGIESVYAFLHPFFGTGLGALTTVRFLLSFIALLIPTTLLGATLPVLVKLVARRDDAVAASAGRLYAVNSIGAAVGTLLATTALIQLFGVNGSLSFAGLINIAIAIVAWRLFAGQTQVPVERSLVNAAAHSPLAKYVLLIFGILGFISMAYQVAWFRLLVQITGTSVYTFGLLLSIFIVSVGLGSALATRMLPRMKSAVAALVTVELVASAFTLLGVGFFDRLPELYVELSRVLVEFGEVVDPFILVLLSKAAIVCTVMLVPTLMFGAAFPLVAKVYAQSAAASGRDVGMVYSVNTLGGVLGSFFGGFVLLPVFGTQMTIVAMSAAGALVAIAIAVPLSRGRLRPAASVAGASLIAYAVVSYSPWNPLLIDAGPYLLTYPDAESLVKKQLGRTLHYYREGVNVNVSVTGTPERPDLITINGKPMASTDLVDISNQYLLGHLPMLLHPEPRDSMVIGLGAGMTFGALARHGYSADVIEISPEVVEGARMFGEFNGQVLDQPNVNIIFDDGRNYLMTTQKKYDVITEDPLDPFFMGSGYLYDFEHFENAREALKPGGVMAQYLPLYQLGVEESRIIMKTFAEVFPYVTVWFSFVDIVLIGTEEPLEIDYDRLRARVQSPEIAQDLHDIGIDNEFDLLANYLFDQSRIAEIGEGLPINTDDYPIIEFLAPRSLSRRTEHENLVFYVGAREADAPDLLDLSAVSPDRAAAIRARQERYFAARHHVMQTHIGLLGLSKDWIAEIYAAERTAAPYPIATAYLAMVHRLAGEFAREAGEHERALLEYERSLVLERDNTEALNAMGTLLWNQRRHEEALTYFARSRQVDEHQVYPLPYLVHGRLAAGDLGGARALNERCLAQDAEFEICLQQRDLLNGDAP